jgi:uncharacterized phiE125 gp8 family phage protein
MALSVVSQSTVEPVSVVEFKLHQRIDHDHEDDLCKGLISAAREHCEAYVNRILTVGTNTMRLSMDSFYDRRYTRCGDIRLPNPPLGATSDIEITYLSSAGSTGTAIGSSVYTVDAYSEPARIRAAYGQCWPTAICEMNAVNITYPVGYTTFADVPGGIKTAVKMLAGHLYEHREAVNEGGLVEVPMGIKALLDPHKWGM